MMRVRIWLLGLHGVSALAVCQVEAGSWVIYTRVGSAVRVISAMAVPHTLGPPYLGKLFVQEYNRTDLTNMTMAST
jgi:hypothetical protein